MGQPTLRGGLLQDLSYLLYFPPSWYVDYGWRYTLFSKQTPFYHFSLPETPLAYSSQPPRRPSATLGSSIGSSFPVLAADLSLGFLLKPLSSE